jgi:tRNA 2-thiouridine synthesizing protein D
LNSWWRCAFFGDIVWTLQSNFDADDRPQAAGHPYRRESDDVSSTVGTDFLYAAITKSSMAGGQLSFHERYHRETGQGVSHAFRHLRHVGADRPHPSDVAISAVQDGDAVTLMLFHDAVLMAVDGAGTKLAPVGPPNRYEEVASHPNVTLWACRPCVDARGLAPTSLDNRVKLGGMNEFHAAAKLPGSKVIAF